MHDVSREEFFRATDDIKEMIGGTNERLDGLNGRTRKLENKVAVMWMLWVLVGGALMILWGAR